MQPGVGKENDEEKSGLRVKSHVGSLLGGIEPYNDSKELQEDRSLFFWINMHQC